MCELLEEALKQTRFNTCSHVHTYKQAYIHIGRLHMPVCTYTLSKVILHLAHMKCTQVHTYMDACIHIHKHIHALHTYIHTRHIQIKKAYHNASHTYIYMQYNTHTHHTCDIFILTYIQTITHTIQTTLY